MTHFHVWLSEIMKEKNVSAAQLSRALEISPSTISLWRSKDKKNRRQPDYDNLKVVISYFCKSKAAKKKALFSIFYN